VYFACAFFAHNLYLDFHLVFFGFSFKSVLTTLPVASSPVFAKRLVAVRENMVAVEPVAKDYAAAYDRQRSGAPSATRGCCPSDTLAVYAQWCWRGANETLIRAQGEGWGKHI
jgi:hypothetical protein